VVFSQSLAVVPIAKARGSRCLECRCWCWTFQIASLLVDLRSWHGRVSDSQTFLPTSFHFFILLLICDEAEPGAEWDEKVTPNPNSTKCFLVDDASFKWFIINISNHLLTRWNPVIAWHAVDSSCLTLFDNIFHLTSVSGPNLRPRVLITPPNHIECEFRALINEFITFIQHQRHFNLWCTHHPGLLSSFDCFSAIADASVPEMMWTASFVVCYTDFHEIQSPT
jgi:hypothetical protein